MASFVVAFATRKGPPWLRFFSDAVGFTLACSSPLTFVLSIGALNFNGFCPDFTDT